MLGVTFGSRTFLSFSGRMSSKIAWMLQDCPFTITKAEKKARLSVRRIFHVALRSLSESQYSLTSYSRGPEYSTEEKYSRLSCLFEAYFGSIGISPYIRVNHIFYVYELTTLSLPIWAISGRLHYRTISQSLRCQDYCRSTLSDVCFLIYYMMILEGTGWKTYRSRSDEVGEQSYKMLQENDQDRWSPPSVWISLL
jgi:hypothetical protein